MPVTITSEQQPEYQDFLRQLAGPDIQLIEDHVFSIRLSFSAPDWEARGVAFRNCKFELPVELNHIDLRCGIRLTGCEFASLTLVGCTASDTEGTFNGHYPAALFVSACKFGRGLSFQRCNFFFGLHMAGGNEMERFQLYETTLTGVYMERTSITSQFEATNAVVSGGFRINRSMVEASLRFYATRADMSLTQSDFKGDLFFADCDFGSFVTNDGVFSNELQLQGCNVGTNLTLHGSIFEKRVSIRSEDRANNRYGLLANVYINDCIFKVGVLVSGQQHKPEQNIGKLELVCTDRLSGQLSFENNRIGTVILQGNSSGASLLFAYCKINSLCLDQFINKGSLSLIAVDAEPGSGSSLVISRSVLGKTFFSDVNFKSWDTVTITHSSLFELSTTSVEWFDVKALNTVSPTDILFSTGLTLKNPAKAIEAEAQNIRKELFRQLKFAMEKQGDQFNKLFFKKEEMAAYRKELRCHPISRRNAGDKLILWFSRSNDYGFNWLKPLLLIFGFTLVFYILLAVAYASCGFSINYLGASAYNFILLLNPTRKITDLFHMGDQVTPSLLFYTLDFLQRLVLSYLLFQMISAFRKYLG